MSENAMQVRRAAEKQRAEVEALSMRGGKAMKTRERLGYRVWLARCGAADWLYKVAARVAHPDERRTESERTPGRIIYREGPRMKR